MQKLPDVSLAIRLVTVWLALTLCHPASADFSIGGSTACDPTKQSCAPDPGGGGSGGGAGMCKPSPGGSTCGGAGPASQGNTSDTNQGAGNPINLVNGNKYQREVDMPALPGVLGLEIVRHYNSQYSLPNVPTGVLGHGWKLSYETELHDTAAGLQIVQADGTRVIFQRSKDQPSHCTSPDPANGSVTVLDKPQGKEYLWRWPGNGKEGGRQLLFNSQGKLVQIAAPTGEYLSLLYSPKGWLLQVRDPQGRELNLNYLDAQTAQADPDGTHTFRGVQTIDSPVGRFSYGYGNELPTGSSAAKTLTLANLTQVGIPTWHDPSTRTFEFANRSPSRSSITRHYHYEDPNFPTLLTGISVQGSGSDGVQLSQRLSTYGYDRRGRAILSQKADGTEKVSLNTDTPGQTILTNALGQKTVYKHAQIAGQWRLLESRGAGCAQCGPANMRYNYDQLARLTQQTRLDLNGQPLSATRTTRDAQSRTLRIETISYHAGKPGAPQLQVRYEYPSDQATEPSLIATPSVLPGREHQIRIHYNAQGQPTEISETGYEPLNQQTISRSTRYHYKSINNNSVLVEIDGPLPNGPSNSPRDSDITRLAWDQAGSFIHTLTSPELHISFRYETAGRVGSGRLIKTTANDGHRLIEMNAAYSDQANIALALEQVRKTAWLLQDGQPDEASRLSVLTLQAQYDALGRRAKITGPAGVVQSMDYDTLPQADPVNMSALQNEGAAESVPALIAHYGPPGSAAQNEILKFEANGRSAERQLDDFGRVVALRNPGQAWQYAEYDLADRITRIKDPRGAQQQIQYDLQGRLAQIQRDLPQTPTQTVSFQWLGNLKESETVRDAQGRIVHQTIYTANALGWPIAQESKVRTPGPTQWVSMLSHTAYDAWGRPISKTFPSGQRIGYRYYANGQYQGQLASILKIDWPIWLDWLMLPLARLVRETWLPTTALARLAPQTLPTGRNPAAYPQQSESLQSIPQAQPGLSDEALGQSLDAAGLPHVIETNKGRLQLKWNAVGELAEVMRGAQSVARYNYDARGRRVSKTTAAGVEYYMYEGTQLLAVANTQSGSLRIVSEYVYAGLKPIAWLQAKLAYTLQTDQRGAVLSVADAQKGTPLWQSQINAWGWVPEESVTTLDPKLRLVNQYYDAETGLSYNVGRYYAPNNGRFISPDAMGITDSIDRETPNKLLLDITAYAAGRPNEFFDPDAAAKITYYAMTTGRSGQALGSTQGYTKARWAFVIEGVKEIKIQGNAALSALNLKYASNGTLTVVDKGGNFMESGSIARSANEVSLKNKFLTHYGENMISAPQFSIDDFDDMKATLLIASFNPADLATLQLCPILSTLLPEIPFAPGEEPINVTELTSNSKYPATVQRIVNCNFNKSSAMPVQYADDVERARVEKIEAAVEAVETSQLDKNCSNTGCPGIDIVGQSGHVYHASYGRTQFTGATFLETVNALFIEEKQKLGLNDDIQQRLNDALIRVDSLAKRKDGWFAQLQSPGFTTCATVANFWDHAGEIGAIDVAKRDQFIKETQLDRQAFIDMACFVPQAPARPLQEGLQSFATESIFSDEVLKNWMMSIFRSTDQFNYLSRILIRNNLRAVLSRPSLEQQLLNSEPRESGAYLERQRAIERNLAMRTARVHNSGIGGNGLTLNLENLLTNDAGSYVAKFLGVNGNWLSARCATPDNSQVKWHGLQMTVLIL